MKPYDTGWLDSVKLKRRYPGGWRETTQPTEAEKAAIRALLEKHQRRLERDKPLTMMFDGVEFGRRRYLHSIAGQLDKQPWNNITLEDMGEFLHGHLEIKRRRIRWGVYYNIAQFAKAWQKRRGRYNRTGKPAKTV